VIAGGVVLDPAPAKRRRFRADDIEELAVKERGDPTEVVLDHLARAGARGEKRARLAASAGLEAAAAERAIDALIAEGRARVLAGDRIVTQAAFDEVRTQLLEAVAAFHATSPLRYGITKEELKAKALAQVGGSGRGAAGAGGAGGAAGASAAPASSARGVSGADVAEEALRTLREEGRIVVLRDKVRLASLGEGLSPAQEAAATRVEAILLRERFAPPAIAVIEQEAAFSKGDSRDILDAMVDVGRLVKVTPELAFTRGLLDEVAGAAATVIRAQGELGVADLKERLGVSRKYAVPLLEYLDRIGVTRRKGDVRVAGPRIGEAPGGSQSAS
jgi:selenocysteine-specific elongation factor